MPESAYTERSFLQLVEALPRQPLRGMPVLPGDPGIEANIEAKAATMDFGDEASLSTRLEVDFALTVARLISDAKNDPAQLRATVYQLARIRLQEQLSLEDAPQIERLTGAFDVAIQRVEAFARQHDGPALPSTQPYRDAEPGLFHLPLAATPHLLRRDTDPASQSRQRQSVGASPLRSNASLAGRALDSVLVRSFAVVGLMAAITAAIFAFQNRPHPNPVQSKAWASADRVTSAPARPEVKAAPEIRRASLAPVTTAATETAPPPGGFTPMPAGFGIFALSSNKLFKLEPSPGRAPDPRAAFTARTRSPAGQKLPSGRVKFIVHRSDAEAGAAENADVRLVARETTFDRSGRPITAFPEDSWATRNVSHPYLATPIGDNDRMYELRNDDAGFTLASGRYTLIHNDMAYDFTIEGPVSDSKHCLERLVVPGRSLHSECGEALCIEVVGVRDLVCLEANGRSGG